MLKVVDMDRFQEKIKEVGIPAFAKECGASERAVMSWLYRARKPKLEIGLHIVAKYHVSLNDIYQFRKRA